MIGTRTCAACGGALVTSTLRFSSAFEQCETCRAWTYTPHQETENDVTKPLQLESQCCPLCGGVLNIDKLGAES